MIPAKPSRNARPRRTGFIIFVLLISANVLGAVWLAASRGLVPPWVAILYGGLSFVTAVAYALDKYRARRGAWRISESTLQLLAMAGGWPGALSAQHLLRHKTRKLGFQFVFWLIVLVHVAFWVWYAKRTLERWT